MKKNHKLKINQQDFVHSIIPTIPTYQQQPHRLTTQVVALRSQLRFQTLPSQNRATFYVDHNSYPCQQAHPPYNLSSVPTH
ncbi:hypothetical protein Hanom_Chr01g00092171 [Helianthus anomalus]